MKIYDVSLKRSTFQNNYFHQKQRYGHNLIKIQNGALKIENYCLKNKHNFKKIKMFYSQFIRPTTQIVNTTLATGTYPQTTVIPVHNNDDKTHVDNIEPMHLREVISRILVTVFVIHNCT